VGRSCSLLVRTHFLLNFDQSVPTATHSYTPLPKHSRLPFQFVCSIFSSTMPIPNGSFIPNFRIGAAIGRILGELMHTWYPTGLSYYGRLTKVIPGGYALVGAAAFSGAVTQTMCVCVIVLEMSSQITHVIPILIANLISNSISQLCSGGLYNAGIKAKKLPYLPDLLPRKSGKFVVSFFF
jgi:chloride channel 2